MEIPTLKNIDIPFSKPTKKQLKNPESYKVGDSFNKNNSKT